MEGKVVPVDQSSTTKWQKTNKQGVPTHLSEVTLGWRLLTTFEKRLVLRFLRSYRYLTRPVRVDYSTITDHQTDEAVVGTIMTQFEFREKWGRLNAGFSRSLVDLDNPRYSIDHKLPIGKLKSSFWIASGPIGKGMVARVRELVLLSQDQKLLRALDTFVSEFSMFISPKRMRQTPNFLSLPSHLITG